MKEILINKSKEVLKELSDYLDGNKPEIEKNFILGRLSVIYELIKVIPIENLNNNQDSHSCTSTSSDVRKNIDFSENINYGSALTGHSHTFSSNGVRQKATHMHCIYSGGIPHSQRLPNNNATSHTHTIFPKK